MKFHFLYFFTLFPLCIFGKPLIEEVLGPSSGLIGPFGVTFDNIGNAYIAEYKGGRILLLDKNGKLSILSGDNGKKSYAGDGQHAKKGLFHNMHNLAWAADNVLYISDTQNNLVRKINGKNNNKKSEA